MHQRNYPICLNAIRVSYVALPDFCSCFGPLVHLLSKTLTFFDFPICWICW